MTDWTKTVKSTLYTPNAYPKTQIFISFALQAAVFEIQLEVEKKTECQWPQIVLEHLTVKGTQYTLNTNPRVPFAVQPAIFKMQRLLNRIEHWILTQESQILLCSALPAKVFEIHWRLSKIGNAPNNLRQISFYDKPFLRCKVVKNQKFIQWHQLTLNTTVTIFIHWILNLYTEYLMVPPSPKFHFVLL